MADMADNLVTLIDEKWSGPAKPDIIEKVLARPDIGKFQSKDYVIVYPLGSGRHVHVTRDYYNVIYGFEILCFTPTSSDRLQELYEEVIDILYNWYLTGVDMQRVVDQRDLSDKKTGKFKYTIHIELEAIMAYKGAAVPSGIPAGEGTYTATALKAESDEEIDIMNNSGDLRAKFTGLASTIVYYFLPHYNQTGYLGSSGLRWNHLYLRYGHIADYIIPLSDNSGTLGLDSYAWNTVYAYTYVDKSKAFDLETAKAIIDSFEKETDKEEIDHLKLHEKVKIEADEVIFDEEGNPEKTGNKTYGRDIGSCVSALMTVVKDLAAKIKALEAK